MRALVPWQLLLCLVVVVRSSARTQHITASNITCDIRIVDVDFPSVETNSSQENDMAVCITQSRTTNATQAYRVAIPDGLDVSNGDRVWLRGPLTLAPESAHLTTTNDTQWVILHPSQNEESHKRRLRAVPAFQLALIVRVTYRGRSPTLTASQLQGRVFGRGPDRLVNNLRSQLEACSHGQYLVRVPRHDDIENGVLEVNMARPLPRSADSVLVLENRVMATVTDQLGDAWMSRLSHILVVLPQHDDIRYRDSPNYLAYAYVGGRVSVFRNAWAGKLSALVHEVSHNLHLSHSGLGRDAYGDMSGYMGYGHDAVGGPRMCFNAQKHYALGWYAKQTRHLFVQDLPFSGWLAFFLDAPQAGPNEPVILALSLPGPERIFLQYNLARGVNTGTRAGRNAVTIVRDDASIEETNGVQSWWVGKITTERKSRTLRYYSAALKGHLVFTLCRVLGGPPSKAHISIHFDGGNGKSAQQCGATPPPFCDDNFGARFDYNGQLRDCGWLIRNRAVRQTICGDPTHEGYRACPETCGVCHDECEDALSGSFFVNSQLGRKDCDWLSSRSVWQDRLCVPGHDAFRLCAESCDRCD